MSYLLNAILLTLTALIITGTLINIIELSKNKGE